MTYNNSVITTTPCATPDPYVTYAHGKFFLTFTAGDRVEIWCSDSVLNFHNPEKHVVWRPPPGTEYSGGLWAPELHSLDGRWWVYVACENPREGNKSHRMYVIGGPPADQDPCHGQWEFMGPLRGVPSDQWAIDGTVIHLNGQRYFVYSGWPLGEHDSDKTQELFIVHLINPVEADGRTPTRLSHPDFPWERSGPSGINEGPQWLASPDGSWVGIAYSCAGSWTKDYKMNTIQYVGGDPMDVRSWRKNNRPLICTPEDATCGPYGPGHGNFIPIGNEIIGFFHATDNPTDGWENRKGRCQRVNFTHHGPDMGHCVGPMCGNIDEFMRGGQPQAQPVGGHQHGPGGGNSLEDKLHGFLNKAKDKVEQKLREL